jgi:uncharacterized protein YndB with AHSA1/START domain
MDAAKGNEPAKVTNPTSVERQSDREIVVTRTFNGPARLVFQAWTQADLFRRWWIPKSFPITLLSCEVDARVGGKYRLVMRHPANPEPMAFFGTYLEVVPGARLAWTNEEAGEAGSVTTVTFEEKGDQTVVVLRDRYPSKEALDEAVASDAVGGFPDQFSQLDELLVTLA